MSALAHRILMPVELDDALFDALTRVIGQHAFAAVDEVWSVLCEQDGFNLADIAHQIDYLTVLAYQRNP